MIRICSRNIRNVYLHRNLALTNVQSRDFCEKILKSENANAADVNEEKTEKLGGFAKAFEKYTAPVQEKKIEKLPDLPFATLLKNSKLVDLGDPKKKVVVGKIFHIVDDDLYIDFGWKFHCVCTRPQKNAEAYVRGARVKLRVKELELSTKFLGSSKEMTILEADCHIVGLLSSPLLQKRAKLEASATAEN